MDLSSDISPSTTSATAIRPFQLLVSTPTLASPLKRYLTCSGAVTTIPSRGANYTFNDIPPFGKLTCISPIVNNAPIGAPNGALEYPFTGYLSKDSINTVFGWNTTTNELSWVNSRFIHAKGGKATFGLMGLGTNEEVMAFFGPVPTAYYIPVDLLVHFPS